MHINILIIYLLLYVYFCITCNNYIVIVYMVKIQCEIWKGVINKCMPELCSAY